MAWRLSSVAGFDPFFAWRPKRLAPPRTQRVVGSWYFSDCQCSHAARSGFLLISWATGKTKICRLKMFGCLNYYCTHMCIQNDIMFIYVQGISWLDDGMYSIIMNHKWSSQKLEGKTMVSSASPKHEYSSKTCSHINNSQLAMVLPSLFGYLRYLR